MPSVNYKTYKEYAAGHDDTPRLTSPPSHNDGDRSNKHRIYYKPYGIHSERNKLMHSDRADNKYDNVTYIRGNRRPYCTVARDKNNIERNIDYCSDKRRPE